MKANDERPRVVIMTDAETDDRCSMVHALLYANDMDIKAIIQTNSSFQRHGSLRLHFAKYSTRVTVAMVSDSSVSADSL